MRGSDFADLRAFAAVARERSFLRAAQRLGMSSSSVSATVRELENRLGLQLLSRTTRVVSVTEAGNRLLTRLLPVLDELDAMVSDLNDLRDIAVGTVRLLTPRLAFVDFLEPIVLRFSEAYPQITLDVTVDDSITDVVANNFDMGVRLGEFLQDGVTAFPIGRRLRQIPVASPSYLAAYGTPLHPSDLHNHRCINWRQQGSVGLYQWEFEKDEHRLAVAVNGPVTINDRSLALPLAVQGIGIAFWVEHRLAPFIKSGELIAFLQDWCPTFPGFFGFYPRQRHMSSALRHFVDFVTSSNENDF